MFKNFMRKMAKEIMKTFRLRKVTMTLNMLHIGPIQTLFPWNLKSLNLRIWIWPSESTSKMSQKLKIWGPVTFKKFSVQSFETLTHNCGKPVGRIKILTAASERGPRDLPLMVLWRYTNKVMIWIFMISLSWWNRRLFEIRNHKLSWNNSYIKM